MLRCISTLDEYRGRIREQRGETQTHDYVRTIKVDEGLIRSTCILELSDNEVSDGRHTATKTLYISQPFLYVFNFL